MYTQRYTMRPLLENVARAGGRADQRVKYLEGVGGIVREGKSAIEIVSGTAVKQDAHCTFGCGDICAGFEVAVGWTICTSDIG